MTGMLDTKCPGSAHNKPSAETPTENQARQVGALVQEAHLRARARRHLQPPLQEAARGAARLFVKDHPWKGGPAMYGKHIISPQAVSVVQSDRNRTSSAMRRSTPARSTATSTARCSTCSRARP